MTIFFQNQTVPMVQINDDFILFEPRYHNQLVEYFSDNLPEIDSIFDQIKQRSNIVFNSFDSAQTYKEMRDFFNNLFIFSQMHGYLIEIESVRSDSHKINSVQPYHNWEWNSETLEWMPPYPKPDDENEYEWSVDDGWVLIA